MIYWAILERPKDCAGEKRARFFREAFGGMRVPLVDMLPVLLKMPGEARPKPRLKAAVFSSRALGLRFETACLMRPGGAGIVGLAREIGFYPVNVDGITIVGTEKAIFDA